MKVVFWANVVLNLLALVLAVLWFRSNPGYESAASAIALAASTLSLFYTKPFWTRQSRGAVSQVGNVAGGDIAGGNINKKG
jgi:hypothetical protein